MRPIRIYSLTDPRDGRVRYVGQTTLRLIVRLRVHVRNARVGKGGGRALREWIAELLALGLQPVIAELAGLPVELGALADELEAQWINDLPDLLNAASIRNVRFPRSAEHLLGEMPDAAVAREVGMDERAVMRARKRLGIASYAAKTGNDGRFRAAA